MHEVQEVEVTHFIKSLSRVMVLVYLDLPIDAACIIFALVIIWLFDRVFTRRWPFEDPPTPAGSGSDSDMYPGAPSSQSREPGVEPRQGKGDPSPEGESP